MKGNENRYWYDKGYSDGVQNTKKDSAIPKIIGTVFLSALLAVDQYWILGFVVIWIVFTLQEWYDKRKHHESDPPERWQ